MLFKILEVKSSVNNWKVEFYPVIVKAGDKLFLIDCGYNETYDDLVIALDRNGLKTDDLYGILITHYDIDHIGALSKYKYYNPRIKIYSSVIEEPSISGKTKSERLLQAEEMFNKMPESRKSWAKEFQESLENINNIDVDEKLIDGQLIEDEIMVIHTPGHTKGHISFYIPKEYTFITGDALVYENNKFIIANPRYTLDLKEAVRSVIKIRNLDIKKIICYHGGLITDGIEEKLDNLISKYKRKFNV